MLYIIYPFLVNIMMKYPTVQMYHQHKIWNNKYNKYSNVFTYNKYSNVFTYNKYI